MAAVKNERRINSLLQQLNRQTGYDEYTQKAAHENTASKELADLSLKLSPEKLQELDRQDIMRLSPRPNENTREELVKEDERHRRRQRVMARTYQRQHQREYHRT